MQVTSNLSLGNRRPVPLEPAYYEYGMGTWQQTLKNQKSLRASLLCQSRMRTDTSLATSGAFEHLLKPAIVQAGYTPVQADDTTKRITLLWGLFSVLWIPKWFCVTTAPKIPT